MNQIGNGSIPLRIGNLINTTVYGGPYMECPLGMFGVKMAVEIEYPYDVSIPTKDFQVPEVSDLRAGIVKALMSIINGEQVYAGCMGGIGRTGIFLAALAKVQIEYRKTKHRSGRGDDPVLYVRKHFIPHAVETKQQEEYIENLDVSGIVNWLVVTQQVLHGAGDFSSTVPARNADELATMGQTDLSDNGGIPDSSIPKGVMTFKNLSEVCPSSRTRDYMSEIPSPGADWLDAEEPDSAGHLVGPLREEPEHKADFILLQKQIDKQEARLTNVVRSINDRIESINNRFEAAAKVMRTVIEDKKVLTKPSLREKIRVWLKDN